MPPPSGVPPGHEHAEEGGWRQTCQHRFWSVFPGPAETGHQHTPLLSRPRPAHYRKVDGCRVQKKAICLFFSFFYISWTEGVSAFREQPFHSFLTRGFCFFPAFMFSLFCSLLNQIREVEMLDRAAKSFLLGLLYRDSSKNKVFYFYKSPAFLIHHVSQQPLFLALELTPPTQINS